MKFFIFILILFLPFISAYTIDYDYYEDLNSPTTISLYGNFTNESQVAMVYGNEYQYLDINNGTEEDTYYFDITISSDTEEDFKFDLYGSLIDNPEKFNYNKSDDQNYNLLAINDGTYYTMKNEHLNHTLEPKTSLICINIDTNNKLRDISFILGTTNGTDNITWYESIERQVQSNELETYCEYVSSESDYINHTDYMGFKCNNCNSGNIMYLGVKDNENNNSYYFETEQDPIYQDIDYMISYHDETPTGLKERIPGEIKFRDAFSVNFEFSDINNVSEDYFDNYNFLYLQKVDLDNSASEFDSYMNGLLDFSWVDDIMGIESEDDLDKEISFWGDFTSGTSTVKLYEPGNYSINLISAQSISSVYAWNEEFLYPQSSDFKCSENIATLEIINQTDQNFYVKLDKYEINKTQFGLNMIRNILIIVLWIGLLIMVGILTKSPWLTFLIGSSTLTIVLALIGVFT